MRVRITRLVIGSVLLAACSPPAAARPCEGAPVVVVGDPVSAEGRAWQQVRSGDREGWVVAGVVR
jgi:hypothetical protein